MTIETLAEFAPWAVLAVMLIVMALIIATDDGESEDDDLL